MRVSSQEAYLLISKYGEDILNSKEMEIERTVLHHGDISCYEHTVRVTLCCIYLSRWLKIRVKERDLIRGALLHDFYLYDWHIREESHKWHGFVHPSIALNNARDRYQLSKIEEDMILKHMFPLTILCPKYKESVILCICDKTVSMYEYMILIKKRRREKFN